MNSMTYKEIFPLIKENKVWMGASIHSGDRKFFVPNDYPLDAAGCGVNEDGRRFIRVKGVRWWTNLDYKQRHEDLILIRKYNPEDYPKYDNYDAIEVSKTKDIPCDYEGIMGVPITFMDKYNPDQFEILGSQRWSKSEELIKAHVSGDRDIAINDKKTLINGTETYDRIFIRNKHPEPRKED